MSKCQFCNSSNSPYTTLCRSCGASIPESATATTGLEEEVRSLMDQGRKIEAVKVYKDRTGSSLKDAKDAVEALQIGVRSTDKDADLDADVLRLLGQGEKIKAVRLYRERTGSTLIDSKKAVEAIATRNGVTVEGAGCSGAVVFLIVALVAIGVVAVLMLRQ